jgi:fatty acid desaturase
LAATTLVHHSTYVRELRPHLAPDMARPAKSRLAFIPVHLAVITLATCAIAGGWVPWPTVPILSLLIGASFAGLTFVGHETVHGAIVRGRTTRQLLGWVCFLPFTLSPRLWAAWHDRVHHANANLDGDPDAYPTLAEYEASSRTRMVVDAFSLGGRHRRGVLSLLLGFTVQSAHQLRIARQRDFLTPRAFRFALVEAAAGLVIWGTVAAITGLVAFLFVFVLPLLVANVIIMSFILTNHSLSPRVAINDPLASGLSVTAPRWVEWLTLNFGYHVEHHLFPAMSSRHAGAVRTLVRARWPTRYHSMPLGAALRQLHCTARVYKDAETLIDPRTGNEYPTMLSR